MSVERSVPGPVEGGPLLLFAYGTLGPLDPIMAEDDGWVPDAVRGRLYDMGAYPGLVDLDDPSADWVEGHVRETTVAELTERLDPYEGVEKGLYRRVRARTRDGRDVWLYEYIRRPLPEYARGPITRWSVL